MALRRVRPRAKAEPAERMEIEEISSEEAAVEAPRGSAEPLCASASEGYGGNCGNAPPAWGQPPEAQPRTAEHGAELQLGDPVHVGAGSVAGSTAAETQPPKRT